MNEFETAVCEICQHVLKTVNSLSVYGSGRNYGTTDVWKW